MPTWSKTIAILVNYTCKRLINIIEPSTNLLIPCTSTLCMYTGHQISQIKDQPFSFSALIGWNLTFFPKVWICFWFIVWFLQNIGTYFFITIIELTGHYLINDHNLFHFNLFVLQSLRWTAHGSSWSMMTVTKNQMKGSGQKSPLICWAANFKTAFKLDCMCFTYNVIN